jgi:hypothetical protein
MDIRLSIAQKRLFPVTYSKLQSTILSPLETYCNRKYVTRGLPSLQFSYTTTHSHPAWIPKILPHRWWRNEQREPSLSQMQFFRSSSQLTPHRASETLGLSCASGRDSGCVYELGRPCSLFWRRNARSPSIKSPITLVLRFSTELLMLTWRYYNGIDRLALLWTAYWMANAWKKRKN